jgi:antitoxin component YwqK of YwqJK toxin-antitoxin module
LSILLTYTNTKQRKKETLKKRVLMSVRYTIAENTPVKKIVTAYSTERKIEIRETFSAFVFL